MKTVLFRTLTIALLLSLPTIGVAQKRKHRTEPERTIVGYISDDSHGLEHPLGADEVKCTIECARHGKFVLADREQKVVYQLDQTGQEKAKSFAGKKVKVRGRVSRKTIRVTTIEAAS